MFFLFCLIPAVLSVITVLSGAQDEELISLFLRGVLELDKPIAARRVESDVIIRPRHRNPQ